MRLNKVKRIFEKGSVTVCGMRGTGKDMLFANIIERRNKPHISNIPYNEKTQPFEYNKVDCGGNTYKDFTKGELKKYVFPYADGTDIYLSDCGVYFPSQYCNELNRDYKEFPEFLALSRQLGECNVHFNAQDVGRSWDKIREQSDRYIMCLWCKVIGKIVIQKIRVYDRYDACKARIRPCRIRKPLLCLNSDRLLQIQMYRDNFYNQHGEVREHILIYKNKSNYDTRHFRTLLKGNNEQANT